MPGDASTTGALTFAAAWLAGLMGSTHCLSMCGGLAGAVGMYARSAGVSPARSFFYALISQLGRVISYALFGAIAGAGGAALAAMLDLVRLASVLRVIAGALMIAIAIRIVTRWNLFSWLERIGARLWSRIAPFGRELGKQQSQQATVARALLFGAVWGWLPCGLVYSMLVFAVAAGNAWHGAFTMIGFGLGTLPAMLSSSLLASQFSRVLQINTVRWVAALILSAFGVWTIVSGGSHVHH
jgi:uncharacterized protein